MNVGAKIQELMDWKGINQKLLAKKTGLANSTISDYVRGARTPSIAALDKIANALDVSITTLVNGEDLPVDPLEVTKEESELLQRYRRLTRKEQQAVNCVVEAFYNRK